MSSEFQFKESPLPSEFPNTAHGIGMGIFWNHTLPLYYIRFEIAQFNSRNTRTTAFWSLPKFANRSCKICQSNICNLPSYLILLTVNAVGAIVSLAGGIFCSHRSEQRCDMFTTLQTSKTCNSFFVRIPSLEMN